jgi:RES domain-containing protein
MRMLSKENEMDANALVDVYIKIRDKRAELKAAFEESDKGLVEKQDKIEQALLDLCKEYNMENLRTEHGTATRVVRERAWASDWEAFTDFVREHEAFGLFEKRISQGNFRDFMDDHPKLVPPVNIDRRYAITVRRSK